ncbi:MAG: penicillin-binding protein 1A, partial [Sphingomonadaceae bacterium]
METARRDRLSHHAERLEEALRALWTKRWVKVLAVLALAGLAGFVILWLALARGLPSAETLLTYEPPLPTNVRDIDGEPAQTFARERRVELDYDEYPKLLVQSYLAAEDKTFFEHEGIDLPAVLGAVVDYVSKMGSDERAKGGSTITQQVAKNLLLGDEYSIERKLKEMILAMRIEDTLPKEKILELYLNQIFLGRNAYGVQAAARAYFDKDVDDLELHEMAYLAAIPKAPSNYTPERHEERALARRNWVLSEMEDNGFITAAERDAARRRPLGAVDRASTTVRNVGGYYMEEVRRILLSRFGENAEDGENSVYDGGLWVRSSYHHEMQQAAAEALRDGLLRFEAGRGWRDPGLSVDLSENWRTQLAAAAFGPGYDEWKRAVVLEKDGSAATLGFVDGSSGTLPRGNASMPKRGGGGSAFDNLQPGMIVAVRDEGEGVYALRSIPEVSGGMVVQQVETGRVLALQGGWDVRGSSFNRATQARRQPGSSFKPIVYAAALDNGMTPATIIQDAPFCVWQGANLGTKCFRNFSGGNAGPQTMRWGLEQSRNLMTVRAANQIGMGHVTDLAEELGVGEYPDYLSIALGAGDTTVMKLTNAFAILANNGREVRPTLIDYVQDRDGKVIYRVDNRCAYMDGACNAPEWDGGPMPRPPERTRQVMDAMSAYQMVHILRGVVERGTATVLRDLDRPVFGKTGTTSGPKDVWFVGGTPEIVAGVYVGYDEPRNLGGWAQGGRVAAPIFKEFAKRAFEDMPVVPFRAPEGIRMVRIDRRSGRKVFGAWPGDEPKAAVIWEAFKPETEPRRAIRKEEIAEAGRAPARRPSRTPWSTG